MFRNKRESYFRNFSSADEINQKDQQLKPLTAMEFATRDSPFTITDPPFWCLAGKFSDTSVPVKMSPFTALNRSRSRDFESFDVPDLLICFGTKISVSWDEKVFADENEDCGFNVSGVWISGRGGTESLKKKSTRK